MSEVQVVTSMGLGAVDGGYLLGNKDKEHYHRHTMSDDDACLTPGACLTEICRGCQSPQQ